MADDWRPDWRDEVAYQHIMTDHFETIAWEFLRRNDDYSKTWREDPRSAMDWKDGMPVSGVPPLSEVLAYVQDCRRYRVKALYHPSTPTTDVMFLPFRLQWQCFDRGSADSDLEIHSPAEVVIKFDLHDSIESQLIEAKRILSSMADDKPKQRPQLKDKTRYVSFLRLLDARQQGANWLDINVAMFDGGDPNQPHHPPSLWDGAQDYCARKYKQLLDYHKQEAAAKRKS